MLSQFNNWAAGKQFILADEVFEDFTNRQSANAYKNMITRRTVLINEKYGAQYTLEDHTNYLITSNYLGCLAIQENDVRTFVSIFKGEKRENSFFRQIEQELLYKNRLVTPTLQALRYRLMHDIDLSDFNPMAPDTPFTEDKAKMTAHNRSEIENWLYDIFYKDPTPLFESAMCESDLWTPGQLAALCPFKGKYREPMSARGIGKKITNAAIGVKPLENKTAPASRTKFNIRGKPTVVYAVRNAEKWSKASSKQITSYYETTHPAGGLPSMQERLGPKNG